DASPRTLTQSILSDQGEELYVVTAIFGESAEIPYDAQLEVEERALTDDGKAILHRSLELTADHTTIYDTVLDVRLVANGVYVEPKTPIEIEIASTVIKPVDSYAVEIALLDGAQAVVVPVENLTGVDADNQIIEKPEYARLKINTTKMGEFALSTVLAKKFIWPLEKETVTIWGPRSTSTSFQETPVNAKYAEGLTMLSRISAQVDPSTSWASNLWASAELNAGVTQGFDGVRCHVMNGEELGAEVFGPSGGVQPVALPVGSAYAFLWDDGYRTSTAEAGVVSFAGSMPLGVKVWADDVTASYADADAVVGIHDEMKYGYRTVTAFDARYEVKSDAWQPSAEHVVNATINVDGASATSDLQVWHVNKGGQYVQVPNVVVSDDTVAFAMDDDGVYILVERVSYERELAATDGATYRVTVNYDKAAGLPDGLQLKVTEVASGTASNFDHVTQSLSVLGIKSTDVNYAKVLDIELVDPVTGMKYQPTDDVRVRIEILDADLAQSESVDVVHFGTRPEVVDTQLEGNDVLFAADGFSVYVVNAYTVDFHQGEYTYS
ncbi:MAG: hypothetical protein UHS51_03700, partial [Atopobiaceae bacterium]|nr:hypothetical protein [Atopobiaceae bacterium]